MKKKYTIMSWRLKLILLLGCLGGLGVGLFSVYVDSISDLPTAPTPLSWSFKSSNARVAEFFINEKTTVTVPASHKSDIPLIDKETPIETKLAIFALG